MNTQAHPDHPALQPNGKLLTPGDLGRRWSKSRMTIYRWCRDGVLPSLKIGVGVRFRPEDVLAFEEKAIR